MIEGIGDRINKVAEDLYSGNNSALARAMGMTPQNLHRYAKNNNTPGADVLLKFDEIGVNIRWLLTGKGEMLIKEEKGSPAPSVTEPEIPFEIKNLSGDAQRVYKQLMSIVDEVRQSSAPVPVKLKLYKGMTEAVEEFQRQLEHDPDRPSLDPDEP